MVVVVQRLGAACGYGSSAAVHIHNGTISTLNNTELTGHTLSPHISAGDTKHHRQMALLQPTAVRICLNLVSLWQDQPPSSITVEHFSLSSVQLSVFLP